MPPLIPEASMILLLRFSDVEEESEVERRWHLAVYRHLCTIAKLRTGRATYRYHCAVQLIFFAHPVAIQQPEPLRRPAAQRKDDSSGLPPGIHFQGCPWRVASF